MHQRDYVKAGVCVDPSDEFNVVCVLESTQCPDGFSYYSSRELQAGSILNNVAKACLELEITELVKLGRCTNKMDDLVCTSKNTSCAKSDLFIPKDDSCTLRDDLTHNRPTYFTRCEMEQTFDFCVWDMSECTGPVWSTAVYSRAGFKYCRCNDVKTGACYDDKAQTHTCAVSALGCDSESAYVPWQELLNTGMLDCRLCTDPPPTQSPTSLPGAPTATPPPISSPKTSVTTGSLDGGYLDGIAVLFVVLTLLVAFLLACCVGRCQPNVTFSSTAIAMDEDERDLW